MVRVAFTLIAVVVLTPFAVSFRVWYQARQDQRPTSDTIIVLGAAQYNGTPSPTLEWRLRHALALYQAHVAPVIVTVGGNQPGDKYFEAGAGKQWLEEHGVAAAQIVALKEGHNTLDSMQAIGRVYKQRGWHTAVIVTDPEHSLRSQVMASDNGIQGATSPTRSGPSVQTRGTQFSYIVRETGGLLWYGLYGRFNGTM